MDEIETVTFSNFDVGITIIIISVKMNLWYYYEKT